MASWPIPGHKCGALVVPEATAGTLEPSDDANAQDFQIISFDTGPEGGPGLMDEPDRDGTRDGFSVNQVTLVKPLIPYTIEALLRPSGTAGTEPDTVDLWEACMGTHTDAASDNTFTFSATNAKTVSLWAWSSGGEVAEYLKGCTVETIGVSFERSAPPKVSFSGNAMDKGHFSATTVTEGGGMNTDDPWTGDVDSPARSYTPDADAFKLTCESETDMTLTSIDYTNGHFVIDRTTAATHDVNDVISFTAPTQTFAGKPISPTVCDFSLDGGGTFFPMISASLTINGGVQHVEPEAGETAAGTVVDQPLTVEGSINFLLEDDDRQELLSLVSREATADIHLRGAGGAGYNWLADMPQCRIKSGSGGVNWPSDESGLTEVTIEFKALPSATGLDSLSVNFD